MGKKKGSAEASEETKSEAVEKYTSDNVDAYLLKKFGNVFTQGNHLKNKVRKLLPVSPALDSILGGGIHEGSNCIITGPPKVGKTTMCLDFAGQAQNIPCDLTPGQKRHVYFFSVEGRLKLRDIEGIKSLDLNHFTAIESTMGNILHAEEFIETCEALINTKPGAIFVVDSYSQLCTAAEMTANIGDRFRADSPLLLARFCRRVCNVLPINKGILMGITHRIANQAGGPHSSPWSEASGNKIQYAVDVKLNAKYAEAFPKNAETQVGQIVHWTCTCTSTNQPPNGTCESLLRYNLGLDKEYELVQMGKTLGLIAAAGSWLTLPNGEKYQGADKAAAALREDPKLYAETNEAYRNLLGFEK